MKIRLNLGFRTNFELQAPNAELQTYNLIFLFQILLRGKSSCGPISDRGCNLA